MRKIYSCILIVFILLTGCIKPDYVKNKFRIRSFSSKADSSKHIVAVRFDADYYSDSTYCNSPFWGKMENGQDGSEDTVVFFGLRGETSIVRPCGYLSFDSFKRGYNKKERAFTGQRYDFEMNFCHPLPHSKNRELLLVLYDKKKNTTDTLHGYIQ